ncbi:MAG TPA: polysaccharide biosynthesis tyrosine autokinase [Gemmatimonadaceae bacterium]|nr:polysaccharide biosynthesis tyrosine autokinase [Gemmatimonadaceae bacterium]
MVGQLTGIAPGASVTSNAPVGMQGSFGPHGPGPSGPPPWGRYASAVRRYMWVIVAITLAGALVGAFAARRIPPQYEASATIWINAESPQARSSGPIRAEQLLNASSWPELLGSFAILDSAALKMQLYLKPTNAPPRVFDDFGVQEHFVPGAYELAVRPDGQFVLTDVRGNVVDRGMVGDSIGRARGFLWAPDSSTLRPGATVDFTLTTLREASVELRKRMSTATSRESSMLRIVLTGEDPRLTAATLKAIVTQFEATAARLKTRNLAEFAAALDQQLSYSAQQLREAEIALETFRVRTITLPSEGGTVAAGLEVTRDPVLHHFFDQRLQLDSVRNDREVLARTVAAVREGRTPPSSLLAVPSVHLAPDLLAALTELSSKEATLRANREVYTDQNPKIIALRASINELATIAIPAMASSLIERLQRQELDLDARVAGSSRELRQIPTRTIEEMRLRRDVDTRLALYTTLKGRYEEARLAEASSFPDMSILDYPAVPQHPSSSPKLVIAGAAVVLSFGAAVALVLLLDHADRRFRYPEQATHELGLEILGVVPRLGQARSSNGRTEQAWQVTEAFRTLRMSVSQVKDEGPLRLTVSSPGSGDGKSFVCSNLALSFVSAGYQTLLIDADVRRGTLQKIFSLSPSPGLTDYLAGNATLGEILRETENGLTVITSGSRGERAPELLASKRMIELMRALSARFDVVIADSAPLSAGIDSLVMATHTTNLLMVLRVGETDRKLCDAKLKLVDRLPIRAIGAVLNAVNATGAYRYYAYNYADIENEVAPPRTLAGRLSAFRT